MTPSRKKLIEVALPLEAINKAAAREKSIRHGHPATLHLWWARRPLAAARAVIFAQMVDDPSANPDLFPTPKAQNEERQRLFEIIEALVRWESTTDEEVLARARAEIWKSWRRACADNVDHPRAKELFDNDRLPAFHDPFAGGGALPLEAQRLGLEAYASDLNPVAVLINKAMIEIPPKFAGTLPVNPEARADKQLFARAWKGAQGLAVDVRYYGKWMRDEAEQRIGHLYPKIAITPEMAKQRPDLEPLVGQELTVIAWLWARTVKSPNPAFTHVEVPLASTFMLSTRPGKEAYVEPVVEKAGYHFTVRVGKPEDPDAAKNGTKLSRGARFRCVMSDAPISPDHIYAEANAGRMGARLMAIAAEGAQGRVYLTPTRAHEAAALRARPKWKPDVAMPENPRWFSPPLYGLKTYGDLFTPRQLTALTTFSELVGEAMIRVRKDAIAAGLVDNGTPLRDDGTGATAYAEAVGVYLGFILEKLAESHSSICTWSAAQRNELVGSTFRRQALTMTWDYAEANCFATSSGSIEKTAEAVARVLDVGLAGTRDGWAVHADAATQHLSINKVISTDPPYYDNIEYADLSDFFYVWMRRSLSTIFPELFTTLAVPKTEELVASLYRHGSRDRAEAFFLDGMTEAMHRLAEQAHPAFPVTIYYAPKQSENDSDLDISSTGWEGFLAAVIRAGFEITGTWPVRTERDARSTGIGTNALASSIVLVCRPGREPTSVATRREFIAALKVELPQTLSQLQNSNIAPVDLAQAAIGPGMAVYARYAKVLDAEGKPIPMRAALALINQTLDEVLTEQERDFDADSRWALAWFEQFGFNDGPFGEADTLSKAKNIAVNGLVEAGIIESKRGTVRLYRPDEFPETWDPESDASFTVWEIVHHVIRALEKHREGAAAKLVRKLGAKAEAARELGYRLYTVSERKKRTQEALRYNALVQSWPEIVRLARASTPPAQAELSRGQED